MAFKAAICPSCGGQLQVPDDHDSVKCMYCGTDIVVREAIQAGSGVNLENLSTLAKTAYKAGNFQEAYNYYSKILEIDIKNPEAWYGKAKSAGWLSNLSDYRIPEMISGFENAIKYIPDNKKKALQIQCATSIYEVSEAYFQLAKNHILKNSNIDGTYESYLSQCEKLFSTLEYGYNLNPQDRQIVLEIIGICKDNIEGVNYKYWNPLIKGYSNGVRRPTDSYEKALKAKMDHYSKIMNQLDPTYKLPEVKKKSSCCFVITATMGDSYHPYVTTLQDFRDSWLVKRSYGRIFSGYYYRCGPYIADVIRERKTLRLLSLNIIVKPSVWIASNLLNKQDK